MPLETTTAIEMNEVEKRLMIAERDRLPEVSINTRIMRQLLEDIGANVRVSELEDEVAELKGVDDQLDDLQRYVDRANDAKDEAEKLADKLNDRILELEDELRDAQGKAA